MDNTYVGKYRMYAVFAKFLAFFATIFGDVKTLVAKIAVFDAAWTALKDIVPDESVAAKDTKPITITKNKLLELMRKKLMNMGKLGKLLAKDKNDEDLAAAFSFKVEDLRVSEPEFIALAKKLLGHFKKNSAALLTYGLASEDISDLEKWIPIAEQNIGKPRSLKVLTSVTNSKVDQAFEKVDAAVEDLQTQISGIYGEGMKSANPEIIDALAKASKVLVVAHTTGIHFLFVNAATKEPIPNVKVDIPILKKKGEADLDGKAKVEEVKTTQAIATCTHPEYETKNVTVKAKRGKIIEVVVELVKKIDKE